MATKCTLYKLLVVLVETCYSCICYYCVYVYYSYVVRFNRLVYLFCFVDVMCDIYECVYIYIYIIVSPVSVYVLTKVRKNGRAYGYTRNYAKCVVCNLFGWNRKTWKEKTTQLFLLGQQQWGCCCVVGTLSTGTIDIDVYGWHVNKDMTVTTGDIKVMRMYVLRCPVIASCTD